MKNIKQAAFFKTGMVGLLLGAVLFSMQAVAGYQYQQQEGGYTFHFSLSGDTLVEGENRLTLRITDAAGNAVTGSRPKIKFNMPATKGMMPMHHKARVAAEGDHYVATIAPSMPGKWIVELAVRLGKSRIKVKLPHFMVGGGMKM